MKVNILLGFVGLVAMLFLASCSAEPTKEPEPKIFIVEEKEPIRFVVEEGPKVFEVAQDNPLAWYDESREKRDNLTRTRAIKEFEDDETVYEIEHRYQNVRRVIDDKLVVGYDEA